MEEARQAFLGATKHIPDQVKLRMGKFLEHLHTGISIEKACKAVPITRQTYYNWRKWYPEFRQLIEESFRPKIPIGRSSEKLDFETFRRVILGRETFEHMRQWVKWFESEENDHILILTSPEAAKTTLVLDYILWRIYLDPDVRIGYASKAQPHAVKQVSRVKNIIEENHLLKQITEPLVPERSDPHPWRDQYFTVKSRTWTPGVDEADYTLSAYGSGSQITGSRFNLLIFDDPDDVNVGKAERDTIWNVILQAGETRLGTTGRMIVIGNRQAEDDVYSRILDQADADPDLWSTYIQKAIIRDDLENPEVLWPEKFGRTKKETGAIKPIEDERRPEYMRRAYDFFDRKRRRLGRRFFLVYQNDPSGDVGKDFRPAMLEACFDESYKAQRVPPHSTVICAMDPATDGGAAVLVYAVLPPNEFGLRKRLLVDFEWGTGWRQTGCVDRIRRYGAVYLPKYWAIDRQGGNKYLTQDPTVLNAIRGQGAHLLDLTTGTNKDYGDFQVSSLAELFDDHMIVLPDADPSSREMHRKLREQLLAYHPETRAPVDGPMALWYAERAVREFGIDKRDPRKEGRTVQSSWRSPYGQKWNPQAGRWTTRKFTSYATATVNDEVAALEDIARVRVPGL
jgi:hypothetical protein